MLLKSALLSGAGAPGCSSAADAMRVLRSLLNFFFLSRLRSCGVVMFLEAPSADSRVEAGAGALRFVVTSRLLYLTNATLPSSLNSLASSAFLHPSASAKCTNANPFDLPLSSTAKLTELVTP